MSWRHTKAAPLQALGEADRNLLFVISLVSSLYQF
jgi:hypothetical protein